MTKIVLRKEGKRIAPYEKKKEFKAIRRYAELAGIKLYEGEVKNPGNKLFVPYIYFCTTPDMYIMNRFSFYSISRDDPVLVKLVEEGYLPNCVIVEISDDVEWYVDWSDVEYCNEEIIIEKHRVWNEKGEEIGRK